MRGIDGTDAVGLAQALTRLLDDARRRLGPGRGASLVRRVTDHVGVPLADLPNVALQLPSWEHVTLHKGVGAYLAAHSPGAEWFGVAGMARGHEDLMGMLAGAEQHGMYVPGAVEYATATAGPDEVVDVAAAPVTLEGTVLDEALTELVDERSTLTRALLGGAPAV